MPLDQRGMNKHGGEEGGRTLTPHSGAARIRSGCRRHLSAGLSWMRTWVICLRCWLWCACEESNLAVRLQIPPSCPLDHRRSEPPPGFEPGTHCLQGSHSGQTELRRHGRGGRARTSDRLVMSEML